MPPIPPVTAPLPAHRTPKTTRIPTRSHRFSASALLLLGFCPSALALPSTTPTWSVEGNETSGFLDVVAGVGDLNADGYEDAAIGGYGLGDCGQVLVYNGGPAGLSPTSSASLLGEPSSVLQFGLSLAGPGDVDGDGYDDVLAGGRRDMGGSAYEPAVWLFEGEAAGLVTEPTWSAGCGHSTTGPSGLVAAAGDVNGDGLGDILLVCIGYAFEYDGDASGEPVLGWSATGTNDGWAGSGVGDVDGDGLDDFALSNGSEVSVYAGATGAPARGPSWILSTGATTTSIAGAGDVDADGYDDLVVANSAAATLYAGGATTLDVAWQVVASGSASLSRAGSAGDVDDDGFGDVYLGVYGWDGASQNMGMVEVFLGGPAGLTESAEWSATGTQGSEFLGTYAAALDADGDGYDDLLVGGYGWANPEMNEGGAWLYPGAPDPDADSDGDPDWRDCDDADATVYTGAPYVCDGGDHDCTGVVDDGQDWYADADGDGFGDDATAVRACTVPAAAVGVGGDCDDTDATVFPGAEETLYDGVDRNCDGTADDQDGDGWSDEGHGGWDCDDVDPLVLPWDCDPADDLVVDGVSIELAGPQTYRAVWVVNGGVISVIPDDGFGYTGWLDLTAYIIFVDGHGSSIDADGAATASIGPGTALEGCSPGSGAGYGGRGGGSYNDGGGGIGGPTYGTPDGTDLALGSSGGGCYEGSLAVLPAGGGGAIGLTADLLRIEGTLSASGADGGDWEDGAGSGGTINLRAAELQLSGRLRVAGGDGQGSGGYGTAAGGGGGGRVRIRSCAAEGTFDIDTNGGTGGNSGSPGTSYAGVDSILDLDGDGVSACDDADDADGCALPLSDWYLDADGDGLGSATTVTSCTQPAGFVATPGDCDDTDSAIAVGSPSSVWYADADGDGLGSSTSTTGCTPPAGYVADGDDCDDTDPSIGDVPMATWYADADGDGLGSYTDSTVACVQPAGYLSAQADCDDTDAATGAAGPTYHDRDLDGYGGGGRVSNYACPSPGFVTYATDCDDHNLAINPGASEVCDPAGIDEDCDGRADDADASVTGQSGYFLDTDGDGVGSGPSTPHCDLWAGYSAEEGDCDEGNAAIHPGAPETDCADPVDYNCDGTVVFVDADGDGWAACEECDDTGAEIHPTAVEIPGDAVDNDCDGVDLCYADADGDGYRLERTVLGTTITCDGAGEATGAAAPGDCNDADGSVHPGATETPADELDADCDGGDLCYVDADGDGYRPDTTATAASDDVSCDGPGEASGAAPTDDCDDADPTTHPGATDIVDDGIDQDCNGAEAVSDDVKDDSARSGCGCMTAGPTPGWAAMLLFASVAAARRRLRREPRAEHRRTRVERIVAPRRAPL